MEHKGTINLIEYLNGVTARIKNRRVHITDMDNDEYCVQIVVKDGQKAPRAVCEHIKGADFTTMILKEDTAYALYYALSQMFELKYKERN